ncbi:MAG TPA: tyrosine--tRNA ligase [Vicinamibacterales bacterium]|nr:tyrosine--tRNA ligase [Vicinamibacterales bacterium]
MNLFSEFEWRGLVYHATEGVAEAFANERVTGYIGFDPTASSLHVGSLLTMMGLARMQRFGHSPIAIVGGGTGMIGDPKPTQERPLLSIEDIQRNVEGIRPQLARLLDFEAPSNPARMINNADWLAKFDLLGFLRDTGKYFTVNYMLEKESVSRRLEAEDGISFTEFSYLLLQARDYLELFDRYGCTLQMGGSDQWGNITAGIELIRKLRGKKAHGLVWPLMKTSSGGKFGKTEHGTIWLDAARTSERDFYQFWLNTDDRDAIDYLKYFTWLDRLEIDRLARAMQDDPAARAPQKRLAEEVTRIVHGDAAVTGVLSDAALRFGGAVSADALRQVAATASIERSRIAGGLAATELVVIAGLAKSKSEAFRLIEQGGISVNDVAVKDPKFQVTEAQALGGRYKVAKGRRSVAVVEIV